MNKTITTVVCTVATIAAVGAWAVASMQADSRYLVPATIALEHTDTLQLTVKAGELPVQQYDAI